MACTKSGTIAFKGKVEHTVLNRKLGNDGYFALG